MSTTTAFVIDDSAAPFVKREVPVKSVGPNDVLIHLSSSGLCHTDLHMATNDWGISTYPMVAGHEGVGRVVEVGAVVKGLKVGQKVGAGWMSGSCSTCAACMKGEENICESGYKGTYLGDNAMNGTFQRDLVVDAKFVYPVPEEIPDGIAAPLLCAGITVYAPLRKWVQPGMNVGIISIGGLGHLAVQFAKALGANVTAFSTSARKEGDARRFGANDFAVFPKAGAEEMPESFKLQSNKFDVILNTCPYEVPLDAFIGCLKPNGVFVYLGLPESGCAELKISLYAMVFGQKTLAGSIVGGSKYMKEMFSLVQSHGIQSSVTCVPFDSINEVCKDLSNGDLKGTYRYCLCWENADEFQAKADAFYN